MRYPNVLKSLTTFMLLAFSLIFFACNENNVITNDQEDSGTELQYLIKRGFNEENIEDHGSFYLIEGDIVIEKATIKEEIKKFNSELELNKTDQRYQGTAYNVSSTKAPNIRVKIDASVSSISSLINTAISRWNNANSLICFSVETDSPDITIYSAQAATCPTSLQIDCSQTNVYGASWASFYGGTPGSAISINMCSNQDPTDRTGTIVHELGHTINLMHTNDTQYSLITGTPTSDANSVMNSPRNGAVNLSSWDIAAVNILYPLPTPQISYFTQNPDPIYNGGSGYVYVHLSQGIGCRETYSWYAASIPSNITLSITPDGDRCYVHYYTPFGTLPTINLTCVVSNPAGTDVESYSVHCALY